MAIGSHIRETKRKRSETKWTDAGKWVKPNSPEQATAKAERGRGSSEQEARCEVLPTQDGPLPLVTIPAVDHEKARRQVLVV